MIIGHIEQFPLFFTVFLPISLFLVTTDDTPALWMGWALMDWQPTLTR
jgi:hypothetical protein